MPIYDSTKPSISQDMLAFEASIREHFEASRTGHSSYWSSTAFLQTAIYTGGGTAVGVGAAPQPHTRLLVNVAADKNLWFRDNSGLTIEAANNAGSANVPLKIQASETQVLGGRLGIGGGVTPAVRQTVWGDATVGARVVLKSAVTGSSGLQIGESSVGLPNGGFDIWNYDNSPLLLATNNTVRMTLAANGDVGIGSTPGSGVKLDVVTPGATSNYIRSMQNGGGGAYVQATAGNGTTSSRSVGFYASTSESSSRAWFVGMDGAHDFVFRDHTNSINRMMISANGRVLINNTTDLGYTLDVKMEPTGSVRFYDGGSSKRGIEFAYIGNETMRILGYDRQSSLWQSLVLECYNAAFSFVGASASFGNGIGVIYVANRFATPTANPANGAIWWVENGASKARGSSGTVTTFAPADPHCPVCGGDFVLEQYNETTGRYLSVCWDCWAEENGSRNWIIRRSRAPRVTKLLPETLVLKASREAEADALIAVKTASQTPKVIGALPPVEPVLAEPAPSTGPTLSIEA